MVCPMTTSTVFYMPLTTCWLLPQPVWLMENKNEIVFPASNSLEENARLWAEHHNNIVEPGHGLFIDFKKTPEFEKPCIDYITEKLGWTLEKPYFIRKTRG